MSFLESMFHKISMCCKQQRSSWLQKNYETPAKPALGLLLGGGKWLPVYCDADRTCLCRCSILSGRVHILSLVQEVGGHSVRLSRRIHALPPGQGSAVQLQGIESIEKSCEKV